MNQQALFYQSLSTDQPFVLVLRAFHHEYYSTALNTDVSNLEGYLVPDSGYDTSSIIMRLETKLDFPVQAIYVGWLKDCCNLQRLQKSLFLIAKDENWEKVIDQLMEKALAIIMMPNSSDGLLKEIEIIRLKNHVNKTYLYLPYLAEFQNIKAANWGIIRDQCFKHGLILPEEYDINYDHTYKINADNSLIQIQLEEVCKKFLTKNSSSSAAILKQLKAEGLISVEYMKSCKQDFSGEYYFDTVIKDFNIDDFINDTQPTTSNG